MDWTMIDQIQGTKSRKKKISNQYQNISVAQGFSSEGPSFIRNKDESMNDYCNNDYEDLELPEVFHIKNNGDLFCKACNINLNGGSTSNKCLLKQHLKGGTHNFFLQIYNNKSEAAILVTEAMKQRTIKLNRGVRFYCRSCSLALDYNSLELLAGHLLNLDHQENVKTGSKQTPTADVDLKALQTSLSTKKRQIEAMDENFDHLTVMGCQLCRAEIPSLNIDSHVRTAKHRANLDKLYGGSTDPLAISSSNDMSTEDAIGCGIVEEKDVMTYFCNACLKLLPADGTINPLKTHLESSNHKSAANFTFDEVKNTVKQGIKNGILVFKFKAREEVSEYSDEAVNPKDEYQDTVSSQDTMSERNTVYQGDVSNGRQSRIHDFVKMMVSDYSNEAVNPKAAYQDTVSFQDTISERNTVYQGDGSNGRHIRDFEKKMNHPKLDEWKHMNTCWFYNFVSRGCQNKICKKMHICSNCKEEHSQLSCTLPIKDYTNEIPTWEEWKNAPICYFYNFSNNGCNKGVSCKKHHMCTHCQHPDHGWLKCTEQDKEMSSKTKKQLEKLSSNKSGAMETCYEFNNDERGCSLGGVKCTKLHICSQCHTCEHSKLACSKVVYSGVKERPFQNKRRRRNEDRYQQNAKYENECSNKNRSAHASYKNVLRAPPAPTISDSYENENFGYYEPQNSYQQYSTENELNYLRRDYHQEDSLHGIVETRDTFRISKSYNDNTLRNTEAYGYQNMESRMQPEHITERNMERISTIASTSNVSRQIIEPSKPFSPFKAVLILGCLCDDLGIFGVTVDAICKKAVEDKDNILKAFKEEEVRMTMKIVAEKLKTLVESAVDEASRDKFRVGLEKVILLLQHSRNA